MMQEEEFVDVQQDKQSNEPEETNDNNEEEEEEEETKNVDDVKQLDIPDSMAIKHNFLEQLSDKLASIKNNKKWSKNNSGNLVTTNTNTTPTSGKTTDATSKTTLNNDHQHGTTLNNNSEFLSDTDLLNAVDLSKFSKKNTNDDLNELNKSKSKWGVNCGSEPMSKNDTNSNSINSKNIEDSDELNPGEISKKISKRKAGNNFTRYKTDTEKDDRNNMDELGNLPHIAGKKGSDAHLMNMPPASSQIQVTLWNDDSASHSKNTKTSLAANGTRSSKATVNQNEQRNKTKNDQITDRILTAAKAASTSKNLKS